MFHFNLSNSNSILHRFVLICGCVIAIGMAITIAVTPRSISFYRMKNQFDKLPLPEVDLGISGFGLETKLALNLISDGYY